MAAVDAILAGKKLTLIQGPPGTGKTRTIVGLVSALLHAEEADSVVVSTRTHTHAHAHAHTHTRFNRVHS